MMLITPTTTVRPPKLIPTPSAILSDWLKPDLPAVGLADVVVKVFVVGVIGVGAVRCSPNTNQREIRLVTKGRSRRASVASATNASTGNFSPAGRGDEEAELPVAVFQTVTVGAVPAPGSSVAVTGPAG